MPKRPKKTVTRRRKPVQQPLFVAPEALGRVLRRVYPELMLAVDAVISAADDPRTPSTVWKAVQDLDTLVGRTAKRSSRCRRGRSLSDNVVPCPEMDAVHGASTPPLLATSVTEADNVRLRGARWERICGLVCQDKPGFPTWVCCLPHKHGGSHNRHAVSSPIAGTPGSTCVGCGLVAGQCTCA